MRDNGTMMLVSEFPGSTPLWYHLAMALRVRKG